MEGTEKLKVFLVRLYLDKKELMKLKKFSFIKSFFFRY